MDKKILDRHKSTVERLLGRYDGKSPFHLYLKKYFSENKKHGSKDRKLITGLCYSYFRLGRGSIELQKGSTPLNLSTILNIAGYISGLLPAQLALPENLSSSVAVDHINTPLARFDLVAAHYTSLNQQHLFPFQAATSSALDLSSFRVSLLKQPDVFLRVRPYKGYKESVLQILQQHHIFFREYDQSAVAVSSNTPVNALLPINKKVVIQDISSQRTRHFIDLALERITKQRSADSSESLQVWDSCAASGGKSILVWDVLKQAGYKATLTVSDIRDNILKNLDKRLKAAGIHQYNKLILDLLTDSPLPFKTPFDIVICDAPCSGSGTWARTPEHLLSFDEKEIEKYHQTQSRIAKKAWQAVKVGGYFLYMTCSVFEMENEKVTHFIEKESEMQLIHSELISCIKENGDSMYGALFYRIK